MGLGGWVSGSIRIQAAGQNTEGCEGPVVLNGGRKWIKSGTVALRAAFPASGAVVEWRRCQCRESAVLVLRVGGDLINLLP